MRHLATIEKIVDVLPIENADSIEKVKIREWWCVAKKGEFKIDDVCIYFEIDSLLPSDNPAFEFLAKGNKERIQIVDGKEYKGYRLKTIKLRGQLSQGLALPINKLLTDADLVRLNLWTKLLDNQVVGEDVSEALGVVKYEPPIPANLAGLVKGPFPGFLIKTDEERIQNCSDILTNHPDQLFVITEKLDGSSCTFYKKNGEFGVCSRNLELKDSEGNTLWQIAHELNLPETLPDGYAVQGEVIGPGIQGNPLKRTKHEFYAFNVYNIECGHFLNYSDLRDFTTLFEIDRVPMIDVIEMNTDINWWLDYASGVSALNPEAPREGIVVRPINEAVEMINGVVSRFSFKVISNQYLLDIEN